MREVDFLTKAVNLARQATEADSAGHSEEAYRLYDTAIEYFLTAIKCMQLFFDALMFDF